MGHSCLIKIDHTGRVAALTADHRIDDSSHDDYWGPCMVQLVSKRLGKRLCNTGQPGDLCRRQGPVVDANLVN